MKAIRKFGLWIVLTLLSLNLGQQKTFAQASVRISFDTFYQELEPYGRWIDVPRYGYVWSPDVGPDFQPYGTDGHWIFTEYGNTWVSDYPWGWAPFHYGRWIFDDYYGWLWIPGYEWGPAWVSWRYVDGYYGWAPLTPGININIYVDMPARYWIFVPERYITYSRVFGYCVRRREIPGIFRRSREIDNYYERNNRRYIYGPRPADIERATRRKVVVRRIDEQDRPQRAQVDNDRLRIYRPEVVRSRNDRDNRTGTTGRSDNRRNPASGRNDNRDSRERTGGTDSRSRPSRNTDQNKQPGNTNTDRPEGNKPATGTGREGETTRPGRTQRSGSSQTGANTGTEQGQSSSPPETVVRPQPQERPEQRERPERQERPQQVRPEQRERTEQPERQERSQRMEAPREQPRSDASSRSSSSRPERSRRN